MGKQIEYIVNKSTRKQITYAAQGAATATEIGRFPAGTQVKVNVTINEVFDGTTPIVTIGTGTTANKFIDGQAITAAGGHDSALRLVTTESERDVVASIGGTGATAGALTVTVDYTLPTNEEVSY